MSRMSDLDLQLQEISSAMAEPTITPSLQMEMRCDHLVRDLDELCGFASNPQTVDLVEQQRVAVGQMLTRIQLIAATLDDRKQRKFRIVQ